ncbi:MAG TPA: flavodoxin domain-containing protein [Gemmatimonadaceae bacterium]
MGTSPILIVYGSSYGQTAKIARRIAERLQGRQLEVELVDARSAGPTLSPDDYAGVVVGSSLIVRGVQPAVRQFIKRNVATLNRGFSAYFQVSASAGSVDRSGREAAVKVLDGFLEQSGWTPKLKASIAGAVNYTQYGFLLRWYMKRASSRHGGATDTSRDHEYTDWVQVDRFANDVAERVAILKLGARDGGGGKESDTSHSQSGRIAEYSVLGARTG